MDTYKASRRRGWFLGLRIVLASVIAFGPAVPAFAFSLRDVPVVEPTNLHAFVRGNPQGTQAERDEAVAVKRELLVLGKALFWDMQLGSDNVQACASCHFNAGADPRPTNQLNPGDHGTDTAFGNPSRVVDTGAPGANQAPWSFRFGVNSVLAPGHFPFHLRQNPTAPVGGALGADPEFAGLIRDTNDVASSQGVRVGDMPWPWSDPIFTWGTANQRKVEPRNAPSMVNAVFHIDMFWDGRASFVFNGQNPFGFRDRDATVQRFASGQITNVKVRIPFAAHASQSVGPPLSDFEMSGVHRQFVDVGQKMVIDRNLMPLARQVVHPDDGVLGPYARASIVDPSTGELNDVAGMRDLDGTGLTYEELIKRVFRPEWTDGGDEQLKNNFALFLGLAMQAYQGSLVADDTPFDRFVGTQNDVRRGGGAVAPDPNALTLEQRLGLDIFQNTNLSGLNGTPGNEALPAVLGGCFNCHTLPETSNSNFRLSGAAPLDAAGNPVINFNTDPATGGDPSFDDPLALENAVLPALLVEPMPMGAFQRITPEMIDLIHSIAGPPDFIAAPTPLEPFPLPRWDLTPAEWAAISADPLFASFSTGLGLYDVGFYNLGVRPTEEDLGRHATAPATTGFPNGLPLAYVEIGDMMRQGVPIPQDVRAHVPPIVPATTIAQPLDVPTTSITTPTVLLTGVPTDSFPAVTRGAFKVPNLRDQQFMGPYFHNGGDATIRQVVEFYARGGNFPITNILHRDADVAPIPGLDVSGPEVPASDPTVTNERRVRALVDFLVNGLTDQRVAEDAAPFDHPQLLLPEGANGKRPGDDRIFELKATGAAGTETQLARFLSMDPFAGGDSSNLGKIAGAVTNAATGDPAQGIAVTAHRFLNGSWEQVGMDYSDGGGNYRIDALVPGAYKVRYRDELGTYRAETFDNGPYTLSAGSGTDVVVEAGLTNTGIDASLAEVGTDAFEPDNARAAATSVIGDAIQSRTLDAGNEDWIKIAGRQGNTYTLETSGDEPVDTYLEVFSADNTRVAANNDGGAGTFSRITYQAPSDGDLFVKVRGANASAAGPYSLTLSATDVTPPTTTSNTMATYQTPAAIILTATDDWSGVQSTEYRVDGGPWTSGTAVSVAALGQHTLEYRSIDNADNEEQVRSVSFNVVAIPTVLSAVTTASQPKYNRSVVVSAKLTRDSSAGAPLAGRKVRLQSSANGKTWATIATLTTNGAGEVSRTRLLRTTRYYRFIYDGTSGLYLGKTSNWVKIAPGVSVTRPSGPSVVRPGRTFTSTGYLKPKHKSGTKPVVVKAYRLESGNWVYKKGFKATASNYRSYTKYSARVKLTKGVWRIRTHHRADALNSSTYTSYRYLVVR